MTPDGPLLVGLAGVVAALALGCGAPATSAEEHRGPVEPTAAPASRGAAARVLEALQSSVADLGAVEVSGGTPGSLGSGRIHAASDLRTGEFRAIVRLAGGVGTLRMIRQSDLTWTKAPPSFWTGLGYTDESARRARGKWVVARAEKIWPLVQSLDPGVAVRALLELSEDDVISIGKVRAGELRGQQVLRFDQGGGEQRVYLTTGPHPRLLRISSRSGTTTTDLDFVSFPPRVRVRLPQAADVLPPT